MELVGRVAIEPIGPVVVSTDIPRVWAFGSAVDGGPQAVLRAPRGRRGRALSGVAIHAMRLHE
eukprot:2734543-Pleurochrysis_carterae.AAC.1